LIFFLRLCHEMYFILFFAFHFELAYSKTQKKDRQIDLTHIMFVRKGAEDLDNLVFFCRLGQLFRPEAIFAFVEKSKISENCRGRESDGTPRVWIEASARMRSQVGYVVSNVEFPLDLYSGNTQKNFRFTGSGVNISARRVNEFFLAYLLRFFCRKPMVRFPQMKYLYVFVSFFL